VCGAIFGAISHTPKNIDSEVEVHTFRDRPRQVDELPANVIQYKPSQIEEIKDYLDRLKTI